VASDDFMTNFPAWLAIQRGAAAASNVFDTTPRYIRNNRDLAEYLHRDFTYQAYSLAALLLGSFGNPALAPNNYYLSFGHTVRIDHFRRHVQPGPGRARSHFTDFARCGIRNGWCTGGSVPRRLAAAFTVT